MITSVQNPKVQRVRALQTRRRRRDQEEALIIEGVRLLDEAISAQLQPQILFYCGKLTNRGQRMVDHYRQAGVDVEEVSRHVMNRISKTETSQGALAIFDHIELPFPEQPDFILILDRLRDPGNLGSVLRSASAAGVQGVFLAPGTVDPFSPKVLRAGMGAHFKLPFKTAPWGQILDYCRDQASVPLRLISADVDAGQPPWKVDLRQPLALIIGGEAEGINSQISTLMDASVTIPMTTESESINAAAAAGVLVFEVVRQRSVA
jgi:RNA methyltransferase, TrmH family